MLDTLTDSEAVETVKSMTQSENTLKPISLWFKKFRFFAPANLASYPRYKFYFAYREDSTELFNMNLRMYSVIAEKTKLKSFYNLAHYSDAGLLLARS